MAAHRLAAETPDESHARATVQSVRRACLLLGALDESDKPRSALELARATGLNRTVAHRLLRTLTGEGLVEQRDGGRYVLGPRTVGFGYTYLDNLRIREAALPYATALYAALEGTPLIVAVLAPAWDSVVLIDQLWNPKSPLDPVIRIGNRVPLTTSASGRCLLAYAPVRGLDPSLPPPGPELKERLVAIRERGGIEWSAGELHPAISAVAGIIFSRRHVPVGAIAVSGPDLEDQLAEDSEITKLVRRATHGISDTLQ